jgi:hypothetical protein
VGAVSSEMLGEDGSVRRGVVMVKQPGPLSPKFGAMSSRVFTQWPQNVAVEPRIKIWPVWTGASRYHNCCIDGGTSSEYFGYHLVRTSDVVKVGGHIFANQLLMYRRKYLNSYPLAVSLRCYCKGVT